MMKEFDELLQVMDRLRNECPWDKEQSIESLRPFLIEEAYECLDAMNRNESYVLEHHIDELGDLLLQIIFQSKILSEETNRQIIKLVIQNLMDKLIRRHPHVFENLDVKDSNEVIENWDKIKSKEKNLSGSAPTGLLGKLPLQGPASLLAQKIGKRAHKIEFDWKSAKEVWAQVVEEFNELKEADTERDEREELGDLLFSLAQWARHKDIDLEVAFADSNLKFIRRFKRMESICLEQNRSFLDLNSDQKEELWKLAKKQISDEQ